MGPGQKDDMVNNGGESSSIPISSEYAAVEAQVMTFGAGSYARKILENMGWKEVKLNSHTHIFRKIYNTYKRFYVWV